MRRFVSLWRENEGSVIVEAALVLPVLFFIFLGVFEYSWVFYQQQLIEIGVRDGTRYLARCGQAASGICSAPACPGPSLAQQQAAQYVATTGSTDVTSTYRRVSGWNPGAVTFSCDLASRSYPTVTGTTSFVDPSLGFFGFLGLAPPTISVSHLERFIGG